MKKIIIIVLVAINILFIVLNIRNILNLKDIITSIKYDKNEDITFDDVDSRCLRPYDTLIMIYNLDRSGDYSQMKNYIYNITMSNGGFKADSSDLIVNGIKNRDKYRGAFTYQPNSLLYHANKLRNVKFGAADEQVKKYIIQSKIYQYDDNIRKIVDNKEFDRLYFYESGTTVLGFIKDNNIIKLFFSFDFDKSV